ncbi:RNA-binding protein [Candidatus Gracilibacteria bacterium]|nr:RNA-binding protein [Candidatus Gracilibacteria bacterium]NUJ98633.1 RNA-binding protein [Candidatus Gracilibacteria bacterium]
MYDKKMGDTTPAEPNNTLFIRSLSWDITSDDLLQTFTEHAEVVSAKVLWDRERNRSKGCGFVEFKDIETATTVKEKFNGAELGGRKVFIDYARKKDVA